MSKKKTLVGEQGGHTLEMEGERKNLYLLFDGVRIAKRGRPGTRHAKKWIPLGPGWEINEFGEGDEREIEIKFDGKTMIPLGPGSSEVH